MPQLITISVVGGKQLAMGATWNLQLATGSRLLHTSLAAARHDEIVTVTLCAASQACAGVSAVLSVPVCVSVCASVPVCVRSLCKMFLFIFIALFIIHFVRPSRSTHA